MIFSLWPINFLEEKIIKESKNQRITKSSPIFSRNFSTKILVKLSDAEKPKMAQNQVAKKIQPVKDFTRCEVIVFTNRQCRLNQNPHFKGFLAGEDLVKPQISSPKQNSYFSPKSDHNYVQPSKTHTFHQNRNFSRPCMQKCIWVRMEVVFLMIKAMPHCSIVILFFPLRKGLKVSNVDRNTDAEISEDNYRNV